MSSNTPTPGPELPGVDLPVVEAAVKSVVKWFRSGHKSSEYWLSAIAIVYNAVIAIWDPTKGWKDQISGLVIAGGAAVYTASRSAVKRKRTDSITDITVAIGAALAGASSTYDLEDPKGDTDETPPVIPA